MCQTKVRVKIANQLRAAFEFNKGVKQGDGLSTTPFILTLDNATQKIDKRDTIYTKSSQISAYSDDIVIAIRSEARMRQVYKEI